MSITLDPVAVTIPAAQAAVAASTSTQPNPALEKKTVSFEMPDSVYEYLPVNRGQFKIQRNAQELEEQRRRGLWVLLIIIIGIVLFVALLLVQEMCESGNQNAKRIVEAARPASVNAMAASASASAYAAYTQDQAHQISQDIQRIRDVKAKLNAAKATAKATEKAATADQKTGVESASQSASQPTNEKLTTPHIWTYDENIVWVPMRRNNNRQLTPCALDPSVFSLAAQMQ